MISVHLRASQTIFTYGSTLPRLSTVSWTYEAKGTYFGSWLVLLPQCNPLKSANLCFLAPNNTPEETWSILPSEDDTATGILDFNGVHMFPEKFSYSKYSSIDLQDWIRDLYTHPFRVNRFGYKGRFPQELREFSKGLP